VRFRAILGFGYGRNGQATRVRTVGVTGRAPFPLGPRRGASNHRVGEARTMWAGCRLGRTPAAAHRGPPWLSAGGRGRRDHPRKGPCRISNPSPSSVFRLGAASGRLQSSKRIVQEPASRQWDGSRERGAGPTSRVAPRSRTSGAAVAECGRPWAAQRCEGPTWGAGRCPRITHAGVCSRWGRTCGARWVSLACARGACWVSLAIALRCARGA